MKELFTQWTGKAFAPFSPEDLEEAKAFKTNQVIRLKCYGVQRPRSIQQNKWIHAIFRVVAGNTEDPDWNTETKVKRNVKMAMKFFKDDIIVHNNKVFFELRSFAFDKMEQHEADIKYNEAKLVCAQKLKVDPEELEARAIEEG